MSVKPAVIAALVLATPAFAAENLDAALAELSTEVLSYFSADPPAKIAIATMVHGDGTCSDLSERASDKLQGELFRAKDTATAIIDRRSLSAIFREQQLVEDGTISPAGAARIAAVEQVDAIVTGKMTQYGDDLEFVVSMLDAVSGTVIGFADASFRLSSRDEDMLAGRSLARCGFAPNPGGAARNTAPPAPAGAATGSGAAQTGGATFSSDFFDAQVVSLFYARDTGKVTFTLRFTNISDKVLDLSLKPAAMSIQDNAGGVLTLDEQISGLGICNDYRYCKRNYQGSVTTLAAATMAQLNFSATGQEKLEDLRVSLTFELYATSDAEGKSASRVVSVGFFDLVPVAR
ncbi:MAG: CsgG/HfaB family protein [Tropicimonas sp.]|uniref:CsgG/HfaB family protein n=1 Tax=Tropicimonas sp. TaxID=2067044 RepID=UPI003A8C2914